jgi:hypothetical protein
MTSLYQLPPEVIVEIFRYTQIGPTTRTSLNDIDEYGFGMFYTNWGPEKDRTWIHLMMSCAWLREVALGAPELWQYVHVSDGRRWHDICDSRKRGMPLTLMSCTDNRHSSDCEKYTIEHLTSARRAHLDYPLIGDAIYARLHQPCPLLEVLHVERFFLSVTNKFLGGASESLTTLILSGVQDISYPGPTFPNLRHLKIHLYSCSAARGLWQWLKHIPKLEALHLTTAGPITSINSEERPLLPALRVLSIHANIRDTHTILDILPEPRQGLRLNVTGSSHGYSDSEDEEARLNDIIDRVMDFFKTRCRGGDSFINPRVQVCGHPWATCLAIYESHLPKGSNICQPFCYLSVPYSALPLKHRKVTRTLRILTAGLLSLPVLGYQDGSSQHMSWMCAVDLEHLHTLEVESIISEGHVHELLGWLTQRKIAGYPIPVLVIRKSLTMAEAAKQRLSIACPALIANGVVEHVH